MYRKTKNYKELNPLNFKGFKIWIYYKCHRATVHILKKATFLILSHRLFFALF